VSTLAEARGRVEDLERQAREHRQNCARCGAAGRKRRACAEGLDLAAELDHARQRVRTWHDLGPDQGELWPTTAET
jgi:hypothetical protein